MTPEEFYTRVLMYCRFTDASITSAFRTRLHQAAVDPDVVYSPHCFGVGADVVYDRTPPEDGAQIAARLSLKLLHEHDHDHLQPEDWRAG